MTEEASASTETTPEAQTLEAIKSHLDSVRALITTLRAIRGEPTDTECPACDGEKIEGEPCAACNDTGRVPHPFPRVITGVRTEGTPFHPNTGSTLVKVRPLGSEFNNKTFIGWYIGDMAQSFTSGIDDSGALCNAFIFHNPVIFIPEINEIVLGMESWWAHINDMSELKEITDADISSALHKMMENSIAAAKAMVEEAAS